MKIYIAEGKLTEGQNTDWVYIQVGDREPVKVTTYATLKQSPEYVLIQLQKIITEEYAAAVDEAFQYSLFYR